ncbi:NDP-sugar epimerase, includes UDP-GlcNAc-inverting 4,6-dehydratase FlaA1 and capsular polysaccharide biosynthesis protein EpsC [Duganella sp. CF517]|uniref:polysaccharide biosynthesis protein n=1 Tax=Duganella sp. CF517 TaxID=1881038 RepID=UPI0008D46A46|nr:nucleoside-diphosphate sugar epimerase/dehydratase [Duganella sp. CF517]SEO05924.1 NDP-sugar epimerase, includes UDP-GlcNAc-inverting 4,6-dehydratase FlaA1 and capsular polysaccharide biosynthesis protein EpsC [Duganella sp. CF517]
MLYFTPSPVPLARALSEKLIAISRAGKSLLMFGADCVALPLCLQLALLAGAGADAGAPPALMLLLTAMSIAALSMSDLYSAVVRYLDQRMLTIAGLGLGGAVLAVSALTMDRDDQPMPSGALFNYWLIAMSYLVASRVAVRAFLRRHTRAPAQAREAVAIYGAGDTGARLAQAMRGDSRYCPVCFIDEKCAGEQRTVGGLRVFPPERLGEIVAASAIRLIVVALPATSGDRLGAVVRMLRTSGVSIKFLHGLLDLADHALRRQSMARGASPAHLPDFPLEQLLGRPPVQPDAALFSRCVRGKSVLVTGAGGSIGSELCRQVAGLGPRRLHLLDHSEYALYTIRQELQASWPQLSVRAHLGSVCNEQLLERVMQEDRIDTIYHAAAYKHVTMVETNLVEGLRNNVVGARAVANIAAKYLVETCVLVSSDKAVRPSTIMGASKRLSELVFQAAAQASAWNAGGGRATTFSMVRFGNVLGSSGSVVPLFRRQLQEGGPLTITDAAMERYFMLIPEAAQLVIQAGAMAEGGEVFVLDMGQPIRIVDLARSMIALAGLTEKTAERPHGDIEISYVGLFPGEKLQEELLIADGAEPSRHPRILRMKEQALPPAVLDQYIELLLITCGTNDRWLIEAMLKTIMSEFTPQTGARAGDGEAALRAIAQLSMAPPAPAQAQAS